jgi:hypothetical protein
MHSGLPVDDDHPPEGVCRLGDSVVREIERVDPE